MTTAAVLCSGGVDSSVALRLLWNAGEHSLEAYYIKIWLEDEMAFMGSCPWQEDLDFVRAVCDQLDVPLRVVSLQREYFARVVDAALSELRAGRTPSPDVMCNQQIKFGAFVDAIDGPVDLVASGHYARVQVRDGTARLFRAEDPVKDQTYFLCMLRQEQLRRCLFPLGRLPKAEVRELARAFDLAPCERPDSQGICFLGRIPYDDFVRFHLGDKTGEIIDAATGRCLGEHRGYWYYTIGQRRGLGLAGGPWYVVDKDIDRNVVHVAHAEIRDERSRTRLVVPRPNWIAAPPRKENLHVKLRHGPKMLEAVVRVGEDGAALVELDQGDSGVAPGQYTVFYDGEECLGGGAID